MGSLMAHDGHTHLLHRIALESPMQLHWSLNTIQSDAMDINVQAYEEKTGFFRFHSTLVRIGRCKRDHEWVALH